MSVIVKLNSKYNDLSATEKKIADFIINNTELIKGFTSSELAKQINVGQSTIVKFVKKFGYKGYTDFKMSLIESSMSNYNSSQLIHNDISIESSIDDIYLKLIEENIKSLKATYEFLNEDLLNESIKILNESNKVLVAGIGTSGLVAKDMHYKLLKIGKCSLYSDDMHISYQMPLLMEENDVCVLISYSGKTKEIIKLAEALKENNTKIILITANEKSPLAKISDIVLTVVSDETFFRTSAMSSRITQLSIIDIMFLGLVKENYETSMDNIAQSRNITGWIK
ncbi:MurR/RpiR family transcriptional regulator [Romboutsia weinsteinii]|uniref:MurR/RpiR family transcriptional regulator n=1 Tax=Romboutsia weinsteinii TaxID=2020949 RepID=A0A371J9A3_9FIRM|nr:MurR/RpiR family transcriptional regulator [Romboutsia weinsteinii]RDY29329.1 MurR/RpiR family transcriptional regulator [Romboutsia weinsteinii]